MNAERVTIFDTTLRDGEQSPGCSMNLDEKLQMARRLEALGVDVIEAGFPVASEDDFAAVRAISGACRKPVIAALCRRGPVKVLQACCGIEEIPRQAAAWQSHGYRITAVQPLDMFAGTPHLETLILFEPKRK